MSMGRRTKKVSERRTERITLRLTPAERLQIETASRAADLQPSEYVRVQALKGRVVMQNTLSLDHATFDQLRRIGVNLNQLARIANINKQTPPKLTETLSALERIIARQLSFDADNNQLEDEFAVAAEAEQHAESEPDPPAPTGPEP
jgi:hypothetical protein